jgi:hypothetical protein
MSSAFAGGLQVAGGQVLCGAGRLRAKDDIGRETFSRSRGFASQTDERICRELLPNCRQ